MRNANKVQEKILTGSILPGNGAAMPTYPSSDPGLKKTVLLTLFPKIHCHTPPSFSGK